MPTILSQVQPAPVSLFGAALGPGPDLGMSWTNVGSSPRIDLTSPVSGSLLPVNFAGNGATVPAASAIAADAPFADLLRDAVGTVERYESQAKSAIEGLMAGTGVDVHEAMIASEKAETGFELVLAVRNKALAAYQQVMGLQF